MELSGGDILGKGASWCVKIFITKTARVDIAIVVGRLVKGVEVNDGIDMREAKSGEKREAKGMNWVLSLL